MSLRTSRKNKQKLLYSLQGDMIPIYETDDEGEIIYEDGIPVKSGDSFVGYQEPVEFYGNLSFYTGWNYPGIWGVTLNNADAILLMDKNELPIDETSRIWFESEPVVKTVNVYDEDTGQMVEKTVTDADSADFSVSRIVPSLNCVRYALKGIEK